MTGPTIWRKTGVPEGWTYWHVELADHALVLAEGVPAEGFVGDAERMASDSWAEHQALCLEGCSFWEVCRSHARSRASD